MHEIFEDIGVVILGLIFMLYVFTTGTAEEMVHAFLDDIVFVVVNFKGE